MAQRTAVATRGRSAVRESDRKVGQPWTWHYYAALVGGLFLSWGAWTIIAWLAKGPYQITEFRDTNSASWVAAHVFEGVMVVAALGLGGFVIRGVRRERRLTFDAQLCIAAFSCWWLDPTLNFFMPVFSYSSNFVNVANWCSQMPFVVNQECGRMPEPVIYIGILYLVGFLGAAIAGGWFMRSVKRRFPDLSTAKLMVLLGLFALVLDFFWELPMVHLHLWNYPWQPNSFSVFAPETRWALVAAVAAVYFWGALAAIRYFKDDRGQTIFERGLDHLSPRRRTALSLMSLVGFLQVLLVLTQVPFILGGVYASPPPAKTPLHIVNGMCDMAGLHGTRYGPCPGSPGFTAPIRKLPGENPPAGSWKR